MPRPCTNIIPGGPPPVPAGAGSLTRPCTFIPSTTSQTECSVTGSRLRASAADLLRPERRQGHRSRESGRLRRPLGRTEQAVRPAVGAEPRGEVGVVELL